MSEPERYDDDSGDGDYCEVEISSRGIPVISTYDNGDGESTTVRIKPEDIPRLIAQLTAAQGEPLGNSEQLSDDILNVIEAAANATAEAIWTLPVGANHTEPILLRNVLKDVSVMAESGQLPDRRVQLGEDSIELLEVLRQHRGLSTTGMIQYLVPTFAKTLQKLLHLKNLGLCRDEDLRDDDSGEGWSIWFLTPEGIAELERSEHEIDTIVKAVVTPPKDTMKVRIAVVATADGKFRVVYEEDLPEINEGEDGQPVTKSIITARLPKPVVHEVHEVRGEVEVCDGETDGN